MKEIKNKKIKTATLLILGVIFIVLASVFIGVWLRKRLNEQDPAASQPQGQAIPEPPAVEGQTFLPAGELPAGIEQEMILDDGASNIQSYYYTDAQTGRKQSTILYETQLSLFDIKRAYIEYFSKNGWAIKSETGATVDNQLYLGAHDSAGKRDAYVTASLNEVDGRMVVDLTLLDL